VTYERRPGGGAFVMVYLLGLALIAFPLMLMGRQCRHKKLG
jgi:SNF family Na+-dependent transporter